MYKEEDLVRIAQRKNNTKRGYLVVNPLQGKHCPVSPKKVMELFSELEKQLENHYKNEIILFVGFAETATAIGAGVALAHGGYYMQTTREEVENVTFFDFSESHSHATQQKLVKTDVDSILPKIDRIIFVEDEVTTGNTILNIITLLRETYENPPSFAVLSFLNGMNTEALTSYEKQHIPLHYLVKTDHSSYEERAQAFSADGSAHDEKVVKNTKSPYKLHQCNKNYINTRRLCDAKEYALKCTSLWDFVKKSNILPNNETQKILVLGTEEFMYPPLFVAEKLESQGHNVNFHATTRSPIAVSREENYPLHESWLLSSFYEENRDTYVYELGKYHTVLILTDSKEFQEKGAESLVCALTEMGNKNIHVIKWK